MNFTPTPRSLLAYQGVASVPGEIDLLPLPVPNLESEEDGVREQLVAARSKLERKLASPNDVLDLADTFGELGGLYYLYDLRDAATVAFENATLLAPGEPRWRYMLAVSKSLAGAQAEALSDFDQVLVMLPDHLPTLIRRARLLFDLGRVEEARSSFQLALAEEPNSAAALGGLGSAELSLGLHAEALLHLQRALELQPAADSLYYPLGQVLRARGDISGAREALAKNRQGRLQFLDPWVQGIDDSNVSAEGDFHAGNRAARRGAMVSAAKSFEAFLAKKPDDARARHRLGMAYLDLGKRAQGVDLLRSAVELDPTIYGAQWVLADALAEDGQFEASLEFYERAHQQDPVESDIVADWATALAKLGRNERALALIAPLVGEGSQEHYARLKYATILAISGQMARAQPLLVELSESPGLRQDLRAEAHYHLGSLALARNEVDLARTSFEKALGLDPDLVLASASLAPLVARSGDLDGAEVLFSQVTAARPTDERAQFGRVMTLLLSGRDADALAVLESALEALPDDAALRHALARLLATSGDAEVRDGTRSLGVARELLRESPSPDYAQTLAMALAENGSFGEAAELQQRVVEQAERAGVAQGRAHQERLQRLELYRSGTPVRSPWRSEP